MSALQDPEHYEQDLRRATARRRVLAAILSLLLIGPLAAWRIYRVYDRLSAPAEDPPGVRVVVRSDGSYQVPGCHADLRDCLDQTHRTESRRPGGGHYRCVIAPQQGAPEAALRLAIASCFSAGLLPEQLPAARP